MERKNVIDFLTLVFFFGILLSVLIYCGIGALMRDGSGVDTNTESSDIYQSAVGADFAASFYGDSIIRSFIRHTDYRIFRQTSSKNTLIGRNGWIFETVNSENGYNYLLDYVGGMSFSEQELASISENIRAEREYYESIGTDYLVVVIPSSMAVCEDNLPAFLGTRSDNTRLSGLTAYLSGESAYIDPTQKMIEDSAIETPYNNTEDSINAYGAYSIYNAVMTQLTARSGAPMLRLRYEEIPFSVRITDGKHASASAGLGNIAKNRTVSLTEEMTSNYEIYEYNTGYITTGKKNGGAGTPTVLLSLPDEWERIQMMPLFSNTFDTVIYVESEDYSIEGTAAHSPDIVIRMVRESELLELLK